MLNLLITIQFILQLLNILISGSKEELDDLKNVYTEYEGDMDDIMDNMMCSTMEDESRYRQVFGGQGSHWGGGRLGVQEQ